MVDEPVAVLDESALTGEPLPDRPARRAIRSGATNAGATLDLRRPRPAAESSYAAIVRLVQEPAPEAPPSFGSPTATPRSSSRSRSRSRRSRGPPAATGSRPGRARRRHARAPSPAAPVALVRGVSAAARRGVIVKGAP